MDSKLTPNSFDSPKDGYQAIDKADGTEVDIVTAENMCSCGKNLGGACGCKTGKGCGCGSKSSGKKSCSSCSKKNTESCCSSRGKNKLEVFDWLSDIQESQLETQMVEVQFKNTRKGYYLNSNNLELFKGDIVAVEASPGHDIGEVTLTGKLVILQMKKNNYRPQQGEQHRRVYRLAKPLDIEKYDEVKALEHNTMIRAREIAENLKLQMKISDVEYQGDGNKAIFYYIADERVDFRQLIKVYAEQFRVKIEMKQIGARQEAGRVGGIGPCGRELCCSSSMSNFVSVSTSAARYQDISLNPQKLAGQCGKLKCCLNYEVDTYVEAQRKLPSRDVVLDTKDSLYYHFKTDILSGEMTYSTDKHFAANLITIPKDRVYEIMRMNKNGDKPLKLEYKEDQTVEKERPKDILEQENINRFDNNSKNNNKKKPFRGKEPRDQRSSQGGEGPIKPILVKDMKTDIIVTQNAESAEKQESSNLQHSSKNRNNRQKNRPRNNDNRNNRKDNPTNSQSDEA